MARFGDYRVHRVSCATTALYRPWTTRSATLDWPIMLATLIIAMIVAGIDSRLFPAPDTAKAAGAKLLSLPLPVQVLLAITAGICEEFLFLGFGIAVLSRFTRNRSLAGLLARRIHYRPRRAFGWTSALEFLSSLDLF
jgi:membrane protease YdiL (CAAX protease family)